MTDMQTSGAAQPIPTNSRTPGQPDAAELQALLVSLVRADLFPTAVPSTAVGVVSENWAALLPFARKHGMTGLLYKAVQNHASANLPPTVLATLRETYLNTRLSHRLAYEELGALLDVFGRAGIPLVVLKGAVLAQTLYPDPALRPFGDLDLLIHPEDQTRAEEILRARGCDVPEEMQEGADSALWGQQTFFRAGNHPARVELHWHLFVSPYYRRRAQLDWFWAQRAAFSLKEREAFGFDPTAQLLHLSGHYTLHHSDPRLIWQYDLALLLTRWADQLDWDRVVQAARSFGLLRSLQHALRETCVTWELSLPPHAHALLETVPAEPYERLMFSLARARNRQARWIADGIAHGSAHYWLAHLFPSPAYMREHYRIRHTLLLPYWYIARLFIGGYKFLSALLSLT